MNSEDETLSESLAAPGFSSPQRTNQTEAWRASTATWILPTLSAIISLIVFSPILSSPLGPIDDHEYLKYRFLNSNGELLFAFQQGMERAFEDFAQERRVRPLYHLGRTITTALIADNSSIRYWFRLSIASAGVAFFASCALRGPRRTQGLWFQLSIWFAATSLAIFHLSWLDVVGRLGPPDSLGVLGLLLALIGVAATQSGSRPLPNRWTSSLCFGGLILAAGSRENYAVHAALFAITLLFGPTSRRRMGSAQRFFLSVLVLFPLSSVVALFRGGGQDFYGNRRTLLTSLEEAMDFLSSELFTKTAPILALCFLVSAPHLRPRVTYLSIIGIAMMATDYVQFRGAINTYGRYAFVSEVIFVVALISFLKIAWAAAQRIPAERARVLFSALVIATSSTIGLVEAQEVVSRREAFEYASRLNQGFAQAVEEQLSIIAEQRPSAVVIAVQPGSNAYRTYDLEERSVGFYWHLRYRLPRSVKIEVWDTNNPKGDIHTSPFCILFGLNEVGTSIASQACSTTTSLYGPLE